MNDTCFFLRLTKLKLAFISFFAASFLILCVYLLSLFADLTFICKKQTMSENKELQVLGYIIKFLLSGEWIFLLQKSEREEKMLRSLDDPGGSCFVFSRRDCFSEYNFLEPKYKCNKNQINLDFI